MAQNAVRSVGRGGQNRREPRALRSVPLANPNTAPDRSEVVAEILSDGTVRPLANPNGQPGPKAWSEGSISGRSWILWWTRRSFSQA